MDMVCSIQMGTMHALVVMAPARIGRERQASGSIICRKTAGASFHQVNTWFKALLKHQVCI
jgi:hypothetical protein